MKKLKKIKTDWGMADSVVLARTASAKVVTGDPQFKGLSNVVLI